MPAEDFTGNSISAWERAREQFECKTHQVETRLRTQANGHEVWWEQCSQCGRGFRAVKGADVPAAVKANPIPYDHDLQQAHTRKIQEAATEIRESWRRTESEVWWRWYNSYLLSPEWARIRAQVLQRAHGTCEGCGIRPAEQVHHLTYERAGHEMLFDLVAICRSCHESIHPRSAA